MLGCHRRHSRYNQAIVPPSTGRPRHPLTRGPLSNRPQGRSSRPGTEEPGVTARHAATAPTVPPESKLNSPDRRSSAMNSGNREILRYGRKQLVLEKRDRPFREDK